MKLKDNTYFQLFSTFFKIGSFTFGGGWAMISIIQREVVEKHHWIKQEEFLDLLAIAQSMPGILAVNISTVIGDRLKGVKGSLAAALGTILPSFIIILMIAIFLTPDAIKNTGLEMMGIRPAVVALIIAPVITTAKSAGINLKTVFIPVAVALLIYSGLPIISNPVIFIFIGAIGGYLYFTHTQMQKRKEEKA